MNSNVSLMISFLVMTGITSIVGLFLHIKYCKCGIGECRLFTPRGDPDDIENPRRLTRPTPVAYMPR